MPKIEFVASFDGDPFKKGADGILNHMKGVISRMEQSGNKLENLLAGMFENGRVTELAKKYFDGLAQNFRLSEKAAESFKAKAEEAIKGISESGDTASVKISKIVTAMAKLASEAKQMDMSGLGGIDEPLRNLEDMGIAANFLIDKFMDLDSVVESYEDKIGNFKGNDFYKNKDDITAYGKALRDALGGADEAYKAEEEYVKGLEEQLRKITEQLNTTKDQTLITELNQQAAQLTNQLTLARGSMEGLEEYKENIRLRIANNDEIEKTIRQLDSIKDVEVPGIARALEQVKFGTEEANNAFAKYAENTKSLSEEVKGTLKNIATYAGIAFGIGEAVNFVQKVAETREYFQDIESSMKVFLGSAEKSADFTQKLKDYAWYNMFEFSDLAKASQQMIAYGHDVDTIIPRLDMLSNVAAGTHAPLMEMVDAYNRAKSTGVVDGQGIKSWATKGVVIRDVLKEMGEQAVGTSITFEQLNKVLEHLTGEGGMFHNLMQEQLNNISAEKGQLEDNLASMYNEIGEKLQGSITKWYKLQSEIVDNYTDIAGGDGKIDFVANFTEEGMDFLIDKWKEIMSVIKMAVGVYGSWKAAVIAANAVRKAHIFYIGLEETAAMQNSLVLKGLTAEKKAEAIANGRVIVTEGGVTVQRKLATVATVAQDKAVKSLNASLLASPYTWLAAAIAGALFVTYRLVTAEDAVAQSFKRAKEAVEGYKENLDNIGTTIQGYINTLADGNATELQKLKAWEALKKAAPELTYGKTAEEVAKLANNEAALNEELDDVKYSKMAHRVNDIAAAMEILRKASETGVLPEEEFERFKELVGDDFWENLKSDDELTKFMNIDIDKLYKLQGDELRKAIQGLNSDVAGDIGKQTISTLLVSIPSIFTAVKGFFETHDFGHSLFSGIPLLRNLLDNEASVYQNLEAVQTELNKQLSEEERLRKDANMTMEERVKNAEEEVRIKSELKKYLEEVEIISKGLGRITTENNENARKEEQETINDIKKGVNEINNISKTDGVFDVDSLNKYSSTFDNLEARLLKLRNELKSDPLNMSFHNKAEQDVDALSDALDALRKKMANAPLDVRLEYEKKVNDLQERIDNIKKITEAPTQVNLEYDDVLDALDADIVALKKKIEQDPFSPTLKLELEQKEKLRNEIISMKNGLLNDGTLTFTMQGIIKWVNTTPPTIEGKKFDYLSGTYVDEEKPETHTGSYWENERSKQLKAEQQNLANLNRKSFATMEDYENEKNRINNKIRALGGGKKGTDKNKKDDAAERRAKQLQDQWHYEEELTELELAEERAREDAVIAAIQNTEERERQEREVQHRRTIEDLKKKNDDIYKTIYEQRKKAYETANKNKKYENTEEGQAGYLSNEAREAIRNTLTSEERRRFDLNERYYKAEVEKAEAEFARYTFDRYKQEAQAMRDYLKEYGSYEQQRLAIAQEYAQKIAEAEEGGNNMEAARLRAEQQAKNAEMEFKKMQDSINWELVFNDLDKLSTQSLNDLKEKLRKALDAKDITVENAKVLSEKILEIENRISDKTNLWGSMIPALRERQRLVNEVRNAEEDIARAQGKILSSSMEATRTQSDLQRQANLFLGRNLTKEELSASSGTEFINKINKSIEESNVGLDVFSQKLPITGQAAENLKKAFDNNVIATTNLEKAQEELTAAQKNGKYVNNLLKNLTGEGAEDQNFGSAITSIFNNAVEAEGGGFMGYAKLLQTNVNSMADFTDKIGLAGTDFGDAVHGFSEGVNGFMSAIQSLASGDIFGFANGVIDGIQGFGKSITAIFGVNWSGGNEEEHDRIEQELIKANEGLQRSIDKLKESFDNANGVRAIEISNDIIEKQRQFNDNVMERWENDMGYHSAHHSNAYNWEGFSQEQISRMNALLAQMDEMYGNAKDRNGNTARINGSDWSELTNLTPEALDYIRAYLPDIWDFITSRGKYSWVYDSLNEYADLSGKIAEQTEALAENLTQLSASSLHDQFLSDLMDMKKSAKDFGDDFTEILAKAVLNAQIGDLMDADLKAWRDDLAERMKKEGGLNPDDVKELRESWDAIVAKGMEARDTMSQVTGYTGESSSQQSAAFNSAENITYEQADALVGILTAQLIVQEQGNQTRDLILANLQTMSGLLTGDNGILSMIATANTQRESMIKIMKEHFSNFTAQMNRIVTTIQEQ